MAEGVLASVLMSQVVTHNTTLKKADKNIGDFDRIRMTLFCGFYCEQIVWQTTSAEILPESDHGKMFATKLDLQRPAVNYGKQFCRL
jgi:hypothetical protein